MKKSQKTSRGNTTQIITGSLFLMSMFTFYQPSFAQKAAKWVAPAEAANLKNPVEGNAVTIKDAQKLYISMCTPCDGDKGRGDGPAAAALNPRPADYSSKSVQSETDGSLFWKMTTGRGPMQSFKTKLTDAQRWSLVNYIRTLSASHNLTAK